MELIHKTMGDISPLDAKAMDAAAKRLDALLKPKGSLGRLEWIARRMAGITGEPVYRPSGDKTIVVMCADNGVTDEGVTSYPREVTALVAGTIATGLSGVAVLARQAGARVMTVDIGMDCEETPEGILDRKIRRCTGNIAAGPAMTRDEAVRAIRTGIECAHEAIDAGAWILGTGEVGIGNTTTSSAVLHALTGTPAARVVGRGAGLDDEGLRRKIAAVEKAIALNRPDPGDPLGVLAAVGGLDIAGLAGCYLGAASRRVPIVIDGFIAGTAAVVAAAMHPGAADYMFTSHVSEEPGSALIAERLGMEPMLRLGMRLGEGTGCALAFPVIESALAVMAEMGTFADIGM